MSYSLAGGEIPSVVASSYYSRGLRFIIILIIITVGKHSLFDRKRFGEGNFKGGGIVVHRRDLLGVWDEVGKQRSVYRL